MVINAYWPLQLVIYYYVRQHQPAPIRDEFPWTAYTLIGISAGAVTFMRSFGIVYLSGILYVVCANTEIVFVALLSYFVLGQNVNLYQITAIILVIGSVIFATLDPTTWTFDTGGNANSTPKEFVIGVVLTVFSRFLSACNSVVAQKMLGKNKKSPWGVHELCIAQALAPTVILPFTLLISQENKKWGELTSNPNTPGLTALGFIFFALAITKLVDRTCKMSIIGAKSTIFFEGVDAGMKAIAGVGAYLFWPRLEPAKWNHFFSLGVMLLSLGLTVYGEHVEQEKEDAAAKKLQDQDPFSYELMDKKDVGPDGSRNTWSGSGDTDIDANDRLFSTMPAERRLTEGGGRIRVKSSLAELRFSS
jgi:drug/metabolite transporter (DMT)-like permease